MLKRLAYLLLILLFISGIGYLYVNNVLLPVKLKSFTQTRLQDFLRRPVLIDALRFEPLKGFVITGVRIFEDQDRTTLLADIPEISFPVLLAPILKNRNIIIPSVTLQDPHLNLIRRPDKTWNIDGLFNPDEILNARGNVNVLLRKIQITSGRIDLIDRGPEKDLFESFYQIQADFHFRLDQTVQFKASSFMTSPDQKITIRGQFHPANGQIQGHLAASNLPLQDYLTRIADPAELKAGVLAYSDVHFFRTPDNLLLKGHFTLENMVWTNSLGQEFRGTANITQMNLKWTPTAVQGLVKVNLRRAALTLSPESRLETALRLDLQNIFWGADRQDISGRLDLESAALSLPQSTLTGNLAATGFRLTRQGERWQCLTPFDLTGARWSSGSELSYQGDLKSERAILTMDNGQFELTSNLTTGPSTLIIPGGSMRWERLSAENVNLRLRPADVSADGRFTVDGGQLDAGETYRFIGQPVVDLELTRNLSPRGDLNWQGQIEFLGGDLEGLPWINRLDAMTGIVRFRDNRLETRGLKARTLDSDWIIDAALNNFSAPNVDATLTSPNLNLVEAEDLLRVHHISLPARVSGEARAVLTFQGALNQPQPDAFQARIEPRQAAVTRPDWPSAISGIEGSLDYAMDSLSWNDLKGTWDGRHYVSSGVLLNFKRPTVKMELSGDDLDLKGDFNILRRVLQFRSLRIRSGQSAALARGEVRFPAKRPLWLDLRGSLDIRLADLRPWLPQTQRDELDEWGLDGTLTGTGLFRGTPREWKDWQLTFTGSSPVLFLRGLRLENVALKYVQRDQAVSQATLAATVYQGALSLSGQMNLREAGIPSAFKADLTGASLAAWRREKWTDNHLLSGRLDIQSQIEGPLRDPVGLKGRGTVNLVDAYLWRKNMDRNPIGMLFIIPELRENVFTAAKASFRLEQGKIITDDAAVTGEQVNLRISGWAGLDRSYNFKITPRISEALLMRSDSARKGPTAWLGGAVDYHCYGSLGEKPKCVNSAGPLKLIGNTVGGAAEIITDNVGTFLSDVFGPR